MTSVPTTSKDKPTNGAISSRAAGSAGVQYSLQRLLSSSHRANAARHRIRPTEDMKKKFQQLAQKEIIIKSGGKFDVLSFIN